MKKYFAYFVLALFIGVSFTSCLEDNSDEYQQYLEDIEQLRIANYAQYQIDSVLIVNYLAENDTLAKYHEESGIYYNIVTPGEEYHPDSYSMVAVKYKGMLLDETVFEETTEEETASFLLSTLIAGWQIGIPLIGIEGKIILYLPSYYGYGISGSGDIPANTVLIFEIDLVDFY